MGLDQTIYGLIKRYDEESESDGFPVVGAILKLGDWRNHGRLHQRICDLWGVPGIMPEEGIILGERRLSSLIIASQQDSLPGESHWSPSAWSCAWHNQETIWILGKALAWLQAETVHDSRAVVYTACP